MLLSYVIMGSKLLSHCLLVMQLQYLLYYFHFYFHTISNLFITDLDFLMGSILVHKHNLFLPCFQNVSDYEIMAVFVQCCLRF